MGRPGQIRVGIEQRIFMGVMLMRRKGRDGTDVQGKEGDNEVVPGGKTVLGVVLKKASEKLA